MTSFSRALCFLTLLYPCGGSLVTKASEPRGKPLILLTVLQQPEERSEVLRFLRHSIDLSLFLPDPSLMTPHRIRDSSCGRRAESTCICQASPVCPPLHKALWGIKRSIGNFTNAVIGVHLQSCKRWSCVVTRSVKTSTYR